MHIVHGELRKAPFIKNGVGKDGQSTLFAVELSEVIKDYKTGEKSYTNYKAMLFASSQAHVAHYQTTLVEGNFIVLTSEKLKIEVSDCGKYTKLFMDNARLEGSKYIQNSSSGSQGQQQGYQQQSPPQQQGYQQPPPAQHQPAPQQNQGFNQAQQGQQQQQGKPAPMAEPDFDFDDDIPF